MSEADSTPQMYENGDGGMIPGVDPEADLDVLRRIILGDAQLGVPGVRSALRDLENRMAKIERVFDRVKWFALGLGLLNGVQAITWILDRLAQ